MPTLTEGILKVRVDTKSLRNGRQILAKPVKPPSSHVVRAHVAEDIFGPRSCEEVSISPRCLTPLTKKVQETFATESPVKPAVSVTADPPA